MHPVIPYVLAALLFGIGGYGVLVRRNAVLLLMAVELMLNAVNLVLVTADATIVGLPHSGQVFALFVIVIAAAEIGVGLAIVLQLYRLRRTVATDSIDAGEGTVLPRAEPMPEPGSAQTGPDQVGAR
ncbi:MAG: NADH-quinone oxidoreductase subunit NuoK [Micromonosporaceae bacterium]|nr:NADH-quinone oxidoreductase subunit NuoK [Micromonosporaceae bacterium]